MPSDRPQHRPVACPTCGGTGFSSYTTRIYMDADHMPDSSERVAETCPACMGHRTVHPLKAKQIEIDRDEAHEAMVRQQKPALP